MGSSSSDWVLEQSPPPAQVRIAYGPDPEQFGELRIPAGSGPHPLAVAIHGGFWKAQYDRVHIGHLCEALRQEGIATFSLEYRRAGQPGGGYPGTLEDVVRALDVLPSVASHGVEVRRVGVFGHSAGGHLALWLAGEMKRRHGATSPIAGVLSLAGVTDLVRAFELKLGSAATEPFMGATPSQAPDAYAAASPIVRLPIHVPQLLLHGDQDDTVPISLSEAYAERARAVGDDLRFEPLRGAGHMEVIDPRSVVWPQVLSAVREIAGSPR